MSIFTPELTIIGRIPIDILDSPKGKTAEKEICLRNIISLLHKTGIILDKKQVFTKLMEREADLSTGIGNQIAIPHIRDSFITAFRSVIYLLDREIDFKSLDNRKVKLILFSAIPEAGAENYMKLLSKVSGFLRNPDNRSLVFNSDNKMELYNIFRRLENEL